MNPILALVIANIIWGAASPVFKFSLVNIPPFTLAFIRFFFAGLIFLPVMLRNWKKPATNDLLMVCIAAFFGITVNISFFFLGLVKTTSINAPIIASSGPVFIYLLSLIFLHEKANPKVLGGMMIALTGVLVIILSPLFLNGGGINIGGIQGNIFLFIAMTGSVMNTVIGRKVMKKMNPVQASGISFFFGAMTFLPFMINELKQWSFGQLDVHGWTGIIFGVFLSSALAYFLYYYALGKIEAQEVGLFTYIDPVVAVFLAIPLVGEYPNIYFVVGTLLVFGGIYIAENRIHWHPVHKLKGLAFKERSLKNVIQ